MTLGQLEQIRDLRSVWANEAYDFTPWLAREANLATLGGVLGLDLELEGTEQGVGPYAADIVCKDTVSDRYVLIENQLERTDHSHLGQLLTYAAGLNALTVVWVAARFTEEHRAALDWLNEVTVEGVNFFGLEIELWRIGDSPMAPKFNVVAKPNDWAKHVAATARAESNVSDLKKQWQRFWTGFAAFLQERDTPITPRSPRPQHWADFAIGKTDFHLTVTLNSQEPLIWAGLYMKGPHADAHFHLLHAKREALEAEFGEALAWDAKPGKQACDVGIHVREDPTREERWPEQYAWAADALDRLHGVFSQRIKQLDAASYQAAESEVTAGG